MNKEKTRKTEMPKLKLNRETVKRLTVLTNEQLKNVIGGEPNQMPSYAKLC